MGRLRAIVEDWWNNGALQSQPRFREIMLGLVGEAHDRVLRRQCRRAFEVFRLYTSIEEQCCVEPIASSYDHGLMLFGVLFAERAANLGAWGEAYRCCAAVHRQLAVTGARRARLGMRELPHSEVRWCALRVLADCKWQQDESERDLLLAPEQITAEFWRINALARPQLLDDDLRPLPRKRNVIDSLDWCHFNMLKLAYRYLRDSEYFNLAMKFNRNLDAPAVALGEGHWRGCELKGRRLFYLDFEIAKSWLSGTLDRPALEHLNSRRAAAMRAEKHSPLYFASLNREYAWMRARCPCPVEVVSA